MKKLKTVFVILCAFLFIFSNKINAQNITEISIFRPSDYAPYDNFGYNVSISGEYFIAGAFDEDEDENGQNTLASAGSAYIFKKQEMTGLNIKKL